MPRLQSREGRGEIKLHSNLGDGEEGDSVYYYYCTLTCQGLVEDRTRSNGGQHSSQ